MNKIIGFIVGATLLFAVACIAGTCVYLLWDNTIPHVFPSLVENGALVRSIEWGDSIKLAWICSLLFRGFGNNKG